MWVKRLFVADYELGDDIVVIIKWVLDLLFMGFFMFYYYCWVLNSLDPCLLYTIFGLLLVGYFSTATPGVLCFGQPIKIGRISWLNKKCQPYTLEFRQFCINYSKYLIVLWSNSSLFSLTLQLIPLYTLETQRFHPNNGKSYIFYINCSTKFINLLGWYGFKLKILIWKS